MTTVTAPDKLGKTSCTFHPRSSGIPVPDRHFPGERHRWIRCYPDGQIFSNPAIMMNIVVRSVALGIVAVGQTHGNHRRID